MFGLMGSKVRLFVKHPLGKEQSVPLDRAQANYLFSVMRLGVGDALTLINGQDGAWLAHVMQAGKRGGVLSCQAQVAPMVLPPDLWLLMAPIRRTRMDFVVEKAVEMGARRIIPVQTAFTNERFRADKAQAHAVEAAEQCGATFVPDVAELTKLDDLLATWPADRQLVFCDEAQIGTPATMSHLKAPPAALLIGPEGGFSTAEREAIRHIGTAISLGPRILRADTAAVAGLALWQQAVGDWR